MGFHDQEPPGQIVICEMKKIHSGREHFLVDIILPPGVLPGCVQLLHVTVLPHPKPARYNLAGDVVDRHQISRKHFQYILRPGDRKNRQGSSSRLEGLCFPQFLVRRQYMLLTASSIPFLHDTQNLDARYHRDIQKYNSHHLLQGFEDQLELIIPVLRCQVPF